MTSIIRCLRCKRRYRHPASGRDEWFGTADGKHVCPGCQTVGEYELVMESLTIEQVLRGGGTVYMPDGVITATDLDAAIAKHFSERQ